MDDLEYMLQELQARCLYLETAINGVKEDVEDFQVEDDRDRQGGAGSGSNWSYRVTPAGGLTVNVEGGARVVIHKSRNTDAPQEAVSLSPNTTNTLYAVYTYASGETAASWSGPTWGSPPGLSSSSRVFIIAEVETNDQGIDSIIHRHCGDLEVYDLVQC